MGNQIPELVASALEIQELEITDTSAKNSFLETLIESPTSATFEAARSLAEDHDRAKRLLGIRILRELGRPARPFAIDAVAVITACIKQESDDELLAWEIGALGDQKQESAVELLLEFVSHPKDGVRYAVAGAISGAASGSILSSREIDALVTLAADVNPDVRFSAVFELWSWMCHGAADSKILEIMTVRSNDPDSRVAQIALQAMTEIDCPKA